MHSEKPAGRGQQHDERQRVFRLLDVEVTRLVPMPNDASRVTHEIRQGGDWMPESRIPYDVGHAMGVLTGIAAAWNMTAIDVLREWVDAPRPTREQTLPNGLAAAV